MGDYAWFKLLIRGLGVMMLCFSAPAALNEGTRLGLMYLDVRGTMWSGESPMPLRTWLPSVVSHGLAVAFALYLLFGASGLIAHFIAEVKGKCPSCGHSLEGAIGPVCSECGGPIPVVARKRAEKPGGDGGATT